MVPVPITFCVTPARATTPWPDAWGVALRDTMVRPDVALRAVATWDAVFTLRGVALRAVAAWDAPEFAAF